MTSNYPSYHSVSGSVNATVSSGSLHFRARIGPKTGRAARSCAAVFLRQKTAKTLDIIRQRPKIEASPPIRFRIEWACDQGKVTASWFQAHFYCWHLALGRLHRSDHRIAAFSAITNRLFLSTGNNGKRLQYSR